MEGKYEIICKDECGHEVIAYEGSFEDCQVSMKTIREDYPECRHFRIERNAREAAEERLRMKAEADRRMEQDELDGMADDAGQRLCYDIDEDGAFERSSS